MTVLAICGVVLLALVALGIGFLILGAIKDGLHRRHDRIFNEGREFQRGLLRGDAYWFSEDEATYRLIDDLSRVDVSTARANWRHRRQAREGVTNG